MNDHIATIIAAWMVAVIFWVMLMFLAALDSHMRSEWGNCLVIAFITLLCGGVAVAVTVANIVSLIGG